MGENTSIIKKMHHLLFLVGLFSLAVVAQVTKKKEDSPSCYRLEDRKWREGADGLFYNYFRLEVTFAEARATCRAQGGDMVMEKTQATHDAIEKLYSHYKGDLTFWVGILASRNASTWLDGSDIKKTWWSTKIPNAKQNNNGKKNCVYHGKADTWYRRPCNEKGFILCQKKSQLRMRQMRGGSHHASASQEEYSHSYLCQGQQFHGQAMQHQGVLVPSERRNRN